MPKKKSKKVMAGERLPGSDSWRSFWRGVAKALGSKKFLVALGASVTAGAHGDWETVFHLAMVYLGAQGAVDVAGKFKR